MPPNTAGKPIRIIHDGSSSLTHPSPIVWGKVRGAVSRYSRETRVTCELDNGSRSEVRDFQNFEPGTSNFVSRPSRLSQASAIAAEAFMDIAD